MTMQSVHASTDQTSRVTPYPPKRCTLCGRTGYAEIDGKPVEHRAVKAADRWAGAPEGCVVFIDGRGRDANCCEWCAASIAAAIAPGPKKHRWCAVNAFGEDIGTFEGDTNEEAADAAFAAAVAAHEETSKREGYKEAAERCGYGHYSFRVS